MILNLVGFRPVLKTYFISCWKCVIHFSSPLTNFNKPVFHGRHPKRYSSRIFCSNGVIYWQRHPDYCFEIIFTPKYWEEILSCQTYFRDGWFNHKLYPNRIHVWYVYLQLPTCTYKSQEIHVGKYIIHAWYLLAYYEETTVDRVKRWLETTKLFEPNWGWRCFFSFWLKKAAKISRYCDARTMGFRRLVSRMLGPLCTPTVEHHIYTVVPLAFELKDSILVKNDWFLSFTGSWVYSYTLPEF